MACEVASYSPVKFTEISSLHDANAFFQRKDGLNIVEKIFKPIVLKHGVAHLFGVGLVHRHFDLPEGAILVEKDNMASPWKCESDSKYGGKIVPTSWLSSGGKIYPYEFSFIPHKNIIPPALTEHSNFAVEFFTKVQELGLEKSFGLRRLPSHDFKGVLECTEGNVNINFPFDQV